MSFFQDNSDLLRMLKSTLLHLQGRSDAFQALQASGSLNIFHTLVSLMHVQEFWCITVLLCLAVIWAGYVRKCAKASPF